jgi:hypothetical protein
VYGTLANHHTLAGGMQAYLDVLMNGIGGTVLSGHMLHSIRFPPKKLNARRNMLHIIAQNISNGLPTGPKMHECQGK